MLLKVASTTSCKKNKHNQFTFTEQEKDNGTITYTEN